MNPLVITVQHSSINLANIAAIDNLVNVAFTSIATPIYQIDPTAGTLKVITYVGISLSIASVIIQTLEALKAAQAPAVLD